VADEVRNDKRIGTITKIYGFKTKCGSTAFVSAEVYDAVENARLVDHRQMIRMRKQSLLILACQAIRPLLPSLTDVAILIGDLAPLRRRSQDILNSHLGIARDLQARIASWASPFAVASGRPI
jgi:hypothetical protein